MVGAATGQTGGRAGYDPAYFQSVSTDQVARRGKLSAINGLLTVAILAIAAVLIVFAVLAYVEPTISPSIEKRIKTTPDQPVSVVLLTGFEPCSSENLEVEIVQRQAGNDITAIQKGGVYCIIHISIPAERVPEVASSWSIHYVRTMEEMKGRSGGMGMWGGSFVQYRDDVLTAGGMVLFVLLVIWFWLETIIDRFPILHGVIYGQRNEKYPPQGQG